MVRQEAIPAYLMDRVGIVDDSGAGGWIQQAAGIAATVAGAVAAKYLTKNGGETKALPPSVKKEIKEAIMKKMSNGKQSRKRSASKKSTGKGKKSKSSGAATVHKQLLSLKKQVATLKKKTYGMEIPRPRFWKGSRSILLKSRVGHKSWTTRDHFFSMGTIFEMNLLRKASDADGRFLFSGSSTNPSGLHDMKITVKGSCKHEFRNNHDTEATICVYKIVPRHDILVNQFSDGSKPENTVLKNTITYNSNDESVLVGLYNGLEDVVTAGAMDITLVDDIHLLADPSDTYKKSMYVRNNYTIFDSPSFTRNFVVKKTWKKVLQQGEVFRFSDRMPLRTVIMKDISDTDVGTTMLKKGDIVYLYELYGCLNNSTAPASADIISHGSNTTQVQSTGDYEQVTNDDAYLAYAMEKVYEVVEKPTAELRHKMVLVGQALPDSLTMAVAEEDQN